MELLNVIPVQFSHGLVYGMLLFLVASGLTLIFGMMGILNFALQIRNIHELYNRLIKTGVKFNCPPENLRPGVWATYMRDPEGNIIELVEYEDRGAYAEM